jgi:hypothetical protein
MHEHLLHWLEVLSRIGKLPDSIEMIAFLDALLAIIMQTPAKRGADTNTLSCPFESCRCETTCALPLAND